MPITAEAPAAPAAPVRQQLRMWRPHLRELPPLLVPEGYGLRTYRPGDETAWGEIMSSPEGIGQQWTVDKVRERIVEREQFDPAGLFFVTAADGQPVASACAWYVPGREASMGNVHMVCALPAHRGKGLGRLVTLAVLRRLAERGFASADLSTDDWRLPAIKSYLGLGFVPVYLTDPARTDDHEARWSAIFAKLLATPPHR